MPGTRRTKALSCLVLPNEKWFDAHYQYIDKKHGALRQKITEYLLALMKQSYSSSIQKASKLLAFYPLHMHFHPSTVCAKSFSISILPLPRYTFPLCSFITPKYSAIATPNSTKPCPCAVIIFL